MRQMDIDVAVIGAGPAGLAAAIAAKEAGAENVLVIERSEELGGLLSQCIHNGFGMLYFNDDLSGPEYGARFIEKANDLKIDFQLESMVIRITPDKEITAVSSKYGYVIFKPKALVLAMGCREKTRGNLDIPGTRPGGLYTAGTAQRFTNIEGYLPGKKIVILGSGDIGMIMARRLTLEGAKVEAVAEVMSYCGGLVRNRVQCLQDFGIPLLLEHTISNIYGEERVEAVDIAQVDKNIEPIPGTEQTIECDTILTSVGLIPENELSTMAGVNLNPITGGPVVDEFRQTNVPGIFAGGNCVQVHDLVDWVSWEAELAGANAAKYAAGKLTAAKKKITLKAGRNIRYVVPHTITGEHDVTLYMRVQNPEQMVKLKVGDITTTKTMRVVQPAEMLKIDLKTEDMKKLDSGVNELTMDIVPKEEGKKNG